MRIGQERRESQMRLGFTRLLALVAVLAAAATGIAACSVGGDGGGDSDEDQIKDTINEAVTTNDTSA